MADRNCEYIGNQVPLCCSIRNESESFECRATHGICNSNNFRECIVYDLVKKGGVEDGKKS